MRQDFRNAVPQQDFYKDLGGPFELERDDEDHGAREENVLSPEGMRALGLAPFDEDEEGLTVGQKEARRLANVAMRE